MSGPSTYASLPSLAINELSTRTISLTVWQNIMVKGASSLSDFRIVTSQSKHKRFLSAFATVNLIFCLFGLTRISLCPLKFKCLQSCCRIDLSAVAVSPKTGLLPKKERKTLIRTNASRKAAFPFFPVPLLKQLRQKFSNKKHS